MTILFFLLLFSIATVCLSFRFKLKMRITISKLNGSFFPIADNFPSLLDFVPMRIKNVPVREIQTRKNANKALYLFYFSMAFCFILSAAVWKVIPIDKPNPTIKNNYYDSTKPLCDSEKAQITDSFNKDLQRPVMP
jgi:hypothetical protein